MLLAQLDDSGLADLYRSDHVPSADRLSPAEFARLQRELRAVAEKGYATAVDMVEVGLSSVAVCLRNGEGIALGAWWWRCRQLAFIPVWKRDSWVRCAEQQRVSNRVFAT